MYPHINYLIYESTLALEQGLHIFISGHGYGRITAVEGLQVRNRIIVTIAFPVGELGTCYHEFWAPSNHMDAMEEPQEQVLDFIPDTPPQYTKSPSFHPMSHRITHASTTKPRL